MKMPFIVWLFLGVPENIFLVYLALVLSKSKLNIKVIITFGVILSLSSYLIRLMPVTFGVHTIIAIGLLFFIVSKYGEVSINKAIVVSISTILILIIVETISTSTMIKILNVSSEVLSYDIRMRIIISLPYVILLFLIPYSINYFRKR
ncbi:MAG: hypothetical protein ACOYVD_02095 [Bacillota bacterium]